MLRARNDHIAIYHQGEVFSIGGDTEQSMERFDTQMQTQTLIEEPLPNRLQHSSSAMLEKQLCLVGGYFQVGAGIGANYVHDVVM